MSKLADRRRPQRRDYLDDPAPSLSSVVSAALVLALAAGVTVTLGVNMAVMQPELEIWAVCP